MSRIQDQKSPAYASLLSQGIRHFEEQRPDLALTAFKRAAVESFGSSEPWFWMGRIHEERQDRIGAAHCYYLACDMGATHQGAREALKRLGYGRAEASEPENREFWSIAAIAPKGVQS